MDKKPTFFHFLVIATAIAAAALIAAGAIYEVETPAIKTSALHIDGRPRIGRLEAKIELVLIEDLRCGPCHFFTQKIFPAIAQKYIETGRAFCVVVPVSFLEGSVPLANAALSVYKLAPDRFLPYFNAVSDSFYMRDLDDQVESQLLELADQVGGIDLNKLKVCIETNCFSMELEQNLDWAKRIMGREFGTPTLFVNGIRSSTTSIEAVSSLIEKMEKNR